MRATGSFLLVLLGPPGAAAPPLITPDRTIRLFEGKNLGRFETWLKDHRREDPRRVFSVVDQVDAARALRISDGDGGGLITRDRHGEPVYDPKGESQAFEGGRIKWQGRDVDGEDKLGFRGTPGFREPPPAVDPPGSDRGRDRVTNVVNGTVVSRGSESSLTEGRRILIQSEGAEIYFRPLDLNPL